ncbi:MAG: hypothetical protein LKE59_11755 [Eubacterium sp.]|jgi:hypothetical protein|nr:hypothetical protein [Eubacterium sp.]MCH4078827.1 hypothetical protein [Eubacterium sp.]
MYMQRKAKNNGGKTMKNAYFESMYKEVRDYQEKKEAAKKQRSKLFDEEKYDEGTALMKAFEEENKFPYTDGAMKAYWAYQNMNYRGSDCFEVEDLPWPKDMKDFAETLLEAGIDAITVTDQSTGLMDGIYGLCENAWKMGALKTVTRENDHHFGTNEPETKNGIEFTIA